MSPEFIEIEDKTIDEAIEKACQEFGVAREKLNIEIISGESGGFLGLFSKKAKIKASLMALDMDFSFQDSKPKPRPEPKIKTDTKRRSEKESDAENNRGNTDQDIVPVPVSSTAEKAKEMFEGILQRISSDYRAHVHETAEKIILGIEGDESGLLIGKRGQNLDALQYIMNKALNKIDAEHKMVQIDSGEYRKRREEFLTNLAEKIRKKVKKTRKPVSLANMNAHDRRVIHLCLQEDESLVTQSRGEGKYRKIVILPAKTGNGRRPRDKKKFSER